MALKGAVAKQEVTTKILENFEGSFIYDKNIIIPTIENGEPVQIKITLTASKNLVTPNGDIAIPGEVKKEDFNFEDASTSTVIEPTQEEKDNVARMAQMLGML